MSGAAISVVVALAVWAWLGRPVPLPDVPDGRFQCLSYSPANDIGSPLTAKDGRFAVPDGLIAADMRRLARHTGCIRIYSTYGRQGDAVAAAAEAGMRVLAGIWISDDEEQNRREIERALEVAHAHPQAVRALVVGNEVLLRREMSGERLAGIIRSVKARTHLPVAYADILEFWRRNPAVADAVDIALIHVLPYWDDPHPVHIDGVMDQVRRVVAAARAAMPGTAIEIGEVGWPSAGRTRSQAAPTRVNQARFVRKLAAEAGALGVRYNLIEAIDQPWKRVPEGTVGGFWGILDSDRDLKFPLAGPVSEWPQWPRAALFTIVVSLLVLAAGLFRRPAPVDGGWLGLALLGPAAGTTLWMLADQVSAVAYGPAGWVIGAAWIAFAIVGIALLVAMLRGEPDVLCRPAPLHRIMPVLCGRERWSASVLLGLLLGAAGLGAALAALLLAADGRHRDFPVLAFWLPALAAAFLSRARAGHDLSQPRDPEAGAEEGWLAILLILCGGLAIDHPGNREAWLWFACCTALAIPWLGAARAQVLQVAAALRSGRGLPPLAPALVLAALTAALASSARYAVIEPESVAVVCESSDPWWCGLRSGAIAVTQIQGIGWLAVGCAALAAISAMRGGPHRTKLAFAALLVGSAGLVLYNATLSANAVLLAGLLLVRAPRAAASPDEKARP